VDKTWKQSYYEDFSKVEGNDGRSMRRIQSAGTVPHRLPRNELTR
jgi:hypothetical protein